VQESRVDCSFTLNFNPRTPGEAYLSIEYWTKIYHITFPIGIVSPCLTWRRVANHDFRAKRLIEQVYRLIYFDFTFLLPWLWHPIFGYGITARQYLGRISGGGFSFLPYARRTSIWFWSGLLLYLWPFGHDLSGSNVIFVRETVTTYCACRRQTRVPRDIASENRVKKKGAMSSLPRDVVTSRFNCSWIAVELAVFRRTVKERDSTDRIFRENNRFADRNFLISLYNCPSRHTPGQRFGSRLYRETAV